MSLIAKKMMERIVRPQSWFRGRKDDGAPKVGETNAVVYQPTEKEVEALNRSKPCISCRFFRYADGQDRFERDRVSQMLMYDLRWTTLVENTDPRDYGNCDVDQGKLTHKFATCQCFAPKDERSRSIFERAMAAIRAFSNNDEEIA